MNAVNYWRKQNLIITNGSLVVGVYNRRSKNVHTVLLPQERILFPRKDDQSYLLPLRINGEGYSSPISTIGKIFLPLENILEGSSSLLPLRRNWKEYSSPFPPRGRFFFPREEYSSPSGKISLPYFI